MAVWKKLNPETGAYEEIPNAKAGGSAVKATPLAYNFSAYTDMLTKNSGVTTKAEFISERIR